jgi:uncharacterized protein (DUF1778 family)
MDTNISLRLSKEDKEMLSRIAQKERMSISSLIRNRIVKRFNNEKNISL